MRIKVWEAGGFCNLEHKITILADIAHLQLVEKLCPLWSHNYKELRLMITDRARNAGFIQRRLSLFLRAFVGLIFVFSSLCSCLVPDYCSLSHLSVLCLASMWVQALMATIAPTTATNSSVGLIIVFSTSQAMKNSNPVSIRVVNCCLILYWLCPACWTLFLV